MKKRLHLFLAGLCLVSLLSLKAQTPTWTWMKGSNQIDQYANYGTKGVAAASNNPGARNGHATWTDNAGNLWLFGGFGNDAASQDYLNDLWKYDISINQWIWIGGSNTINSLGDYGTLGVASTTNMPGARVWSAAWTDNSGKFWLFGGAGSDAFFAGELLSDLWCYDPALNTWTWVNGSNTGSQYGVYGTQGIPATSNQPGSRTITAYWKDNSDNFYFFGGYGLASASAPDFMNDLWKYNPTTNQWTWMKGSTGYNAADVYGTLGVGAAANTPGARDASVSWSDNNNNLWLFGGSPVANSYYNDLWKYDVALNQWIWMNGSNTFNQPGSYGSLGVSSAANIPGARYMPVTWFHNNELWMFGGFGYNASAMGTGILQDVWKYNSANNQWTWTGGSVNTDQPGVYGTQGTSSPSNLSGSRGFTHGWKDNNNNLWLFGGYGYGTSSFSAGYLNDLWKLSFCSAPNAPTDTTPAANKTICSNTLTTLSAAAAGGSISWYNTATGGTALANTATFTTPVLNATGSPSTYTFYAETFLCISSLTRTPVTVTVNPSPTITAVSSTSMLCSGQSATLTASGASNYTWTPGGPGASITVTLTTNTNFIVTGSNTYGCQHSVALTQSVSPCTGIESHSSANSYVQMYPNPSSGQVYVIMPEKKEAVLKIFNSLGVLVHSSKLSGDNSSIDISTHAKGIYMIQIEYEGKSVLKKLIKQ